MANEETPNPYEAPVGDQSLPAGSRNWWPALVVIVAIPLLLRGFRHLVTSWKYSSFGAPDLVGTAIAAQHTHRVLLAGMAISSVVVISVASRKRLGKILAAALLVAAAIIIKLLAW